MSLTPDEAAQSLAQVEGAQRRSWEAIGYSRSSPFFLTSGLFWTVCYGATQFWPERSGWIWGGGIVFFTLVSMWWSFRAKKTTHDPRSQRISRNFSIMFGLIIPAFAVCSIAVMWPVYGLKIGAFLPLLYASVYTGIGLWMGRRYVIAGITVFVATLIGFYFVKEYFALWMAVFGGGSMILTGFWVRKA